jgi:hypothetical protein
MQVASLVEEFIDCRTGGLFIKCGWCFFFSIGGRLGSYVSLLVELAPKFGMQTGSDGNQNELQAKWTYDSRTKNVLTSDHAHAAGG